MRLNLNALISGAKKHSSEILIGVGIAGMLTTTVLAVKGTPKALRLIEEKKEELGTDKLTVKQTVKATWKCYIPAAAACVTSAACLIGAGSANAKRNAALAAAYTLSETALRDYKDKVVEVVGEKKEQAIHDAVAKEQIERDPVSSSGKIVVTGKGETLCYDPISGRYFKSDITAIRRAEHEVNHRLLREMSVSLNEFYYELGLDNATVGDILGWHVSDGCFEVRLSSQLAEGDTPCLVIGFDRPPKYEFDCPFY